MYLVNNTISKFPDYNFFAYLKKESKTHKYYSYVVYIINIVETKCILISNGENFYNNQLF